MAKMGSGIAGGTAPRAGGALGGIFGDQQDPARFEASLAMLQNAMSGAQGSNSAALSFLAPILGAMIGPKIEAKRDAAKARQAATLTETLLGPGGLSPSAQRALDVMNNPNTPDYLQSIAATMFKSGVQSPVSSRTRTSGPSSGGASAGSSAKGERLYGEYDLGGNLAGRDRYGNIVLYKGPDGSPIPYGKAPAGKQPSLAEPNLPMDPPAPELQISDPLGIR
jgi:hypothetical protein